jgi:AraC-like DNA-binding protein
MSPFLKRVPDAYIEHILNDVPFVVISFEIVSGAHLPQAAQVNDVNCDMLSVNTDVLVQRGPVFAVSMDGLRARAMPLKDDDDTEVQHRDLCEFFNALQCVVGNVLTGAPAEIAEGLVHLKTLFPPIAQPTRTALLKAVISTQLLLIAASLGLPTLRDLTSDVAKLNSLNGSALREAHASCVDRLVAAVFRSTSDILRSTHLDHRVACALAFIREWSSSNRRLSASEIARGCNVSRWHLERLVKKETGLTLRYMVSSARIAEAQRLLTLSDLTIKEIGATLGYSCEPVFSRCFRTHTGRSPTSWRSSVVQRHSPR